MEHVARHLVITGRVQGVWYRGWTTETAEGLGLSGWVRNRSDGSVEAVIAGPREAVDAMIEQCREGPPLARVVDVTVAPTAEPATAGFEQRPTV
ncbi:acylphosphatase [Fodinicurvata sp. EGI_FJ10296]|uniref:acylphosphatase n=1 Tax=Fodinicurvata sp. EGI_FJ10296 TaxID=3231908 RepID=UPI003451AC28